MNFESNQENAWEILPAWELRQVGYREGRVP